MSKRDERVDLYHMNSLEAWCIANDIYYERTDSAGYYYDELPEVLTGERHIIKGLDRETGETLWDCICQMGSFGANEGLLEYWDNQMQEGEDPEGYLTCRKATELIASRGYLK